LEGGRPATFQSSNPALTACCKTTYTSKLYKLVYTQAVRFVFGRSRVYCQPGTLEQKDPPAGIASQEQNETLRYIYVREIIASQEQKDPPRYMYVHKFCTSLLQTCAKFCTSLKQTCANFAQVGSRLVQNLCMSGLRSYYVL
jgi:hypothetical protein